MYNNLYKSLFYLTTLLFTLIHSHLYAQNECKDQLHDALKKTRAFKMPKGSQLCKIKMEAATISPKTDDMQTQTNEMIPVMIVFAQGKIFYESKYFAFYQDKEDVFTIIHQNKTIIWSKPDKNGAKSSDPALFMEKFTGQQDELIQKAKISSCKDVKLEGKKFKELVLDVNEDEQKKFNIKRLTYYLNANTSHVEKQIIDFKKGYKIERQIVLFKDIDLAFKSTSYESAYQQIFKKNGKLSSAYAGYKVEKQ